MEYRILGSRLTILADDGTNIYVPQKRMREIISLLALHSNESLRTDQIIEFIFDSTDWKSHRGALASQLSNLRKYLPDPNCIKSERQYTYVLKLDRDDVVDVEMFRKSYQKGLEILHQATNLTGITRAAFELEQCLSWWRDVRPGSLPEIGDLPDTSAKDPLITELRDKWLNAKDALLNARLILGRYQEIIPDARSLSKAEPDNEFWWCYLILALAHSGRQAEALHNCRLAREAIRESGPEIEWTFQYINSFKVTKRDSIEIPFSVSTVPWRPFGIASNTHNRLSIIESRLDAIEAQLEDGSG